MLEPIYTRSFKKEYKKLSQDKKNKVIAIINTLLNEENLDFKYRDHKLIGSYQGCRECHVEPDLLLIYEILDSDLILHHIDSHSQLF